MTDTATGFPTDYEDALRAYLEGASEAGLGAAYALGRAAVAEGLGLLDLAEAHHAALGRALAAPELDRGARERAMGAAADFLREALATFEVVTRGFHEAAESARLEHEFGLQQRALADASVALNATLEPGEVVAVVAAEARRVLGAARAEATLEQPERGAEPLQGRSISGSEASDADPGARIVAPLLGRDGRPLGRLSAVARAGDRFAARDEAMLVQLAQLASVAADNAWLFERERSIAQTLQRSLLPPRLPDVPGLAIAARYAPTGEGLEVGGDFYDAFQVAGGWALMIGDVCGKGPEAAAVTALARHTVRAAAQHEPVPSRLLRLLSDALLEQRPEGRFVSVAYARVRSVGPTRATLQIALGGHPPPLIVQPDGDVEAVGTQGTLLGVVPTPKLADAEVILRPGAVLVLYTDGVTDVRHDKREVFGLDHLRDLLARSAGLGPATLAALIEEEVLHAAGGRPRDDVAVLTLGLAP